VTDYKRAAEQLRGLSKGFEPEAVLVLGSGLGFLADEVENAVTVPFAEIPGFAAGHAPGHKGQMVFGRLAGKNVAVMQGRIHYYEGHSYQTTVLPLFLLRLMGAGKLILTNAAGGVDLKYRAGDLMLITDHIKFFDESPLRGPCIPELSPRFPDMSYAYSPRLQSIARETAACLNTELREGVYMYFPGPQYETPAEIRAARVLGANAVGMSTVPETIAANAAGYEVLGFSVISNMAAGILPQKLTAEEVLEAAEAARPKFSKLVLSCLESM
jgi:purine-nucleoside phosphorylase